MPETKRLITFLKQCKKFADKNADTSEMVIEGDTTVEDMEGVLGSDVGQIVAGMHNIVSEVTDKLIQHYEKEGNTRMVKKLEKIYEKK